MPTGTWIYLDPEECENKEATWMCLFSGWAPHCEVDKAAVVTEARTYEEFKTLSRSEKTLVVFNPGKHDGSFYTKSAKIWDKWIRDFNVSGTYMYGQVTYLYCCRKNIS